MSGATSAVAPSRPNGTRAAAAALPDSDIGYAFNCGPGLGHRRQEPVAVAAIDPPWTWMQLWPADTQFRADES